jgi:hypothetical protein
VEFYNKRIIGAARGLTSLTVQESDEKGTGDRARIEKGLRAPTKRWGTLSYSSRRAGSVRASPLRSG